MRHCVINSAGSKMVAIAIVLGILVPSQCKGVDTQADSTVLFV